MADRRTDGEIARELGRAESTVRNHRFHFRKRCTEARILLALASIIHKESHVQAEFVQYHPDIPVSDERIQTTVAEAEKILENVFHNGEQAALRRFPKKEKEKLVVLKKITEYFEKSRKYTEEEVNSLIRPMYGDHAAIRRYLVEYRFLCRTSDGSRYWVNA
jgi:hypothetical protein